MKKIAGLALIGYVLFNSLSASAQTYAESALLFSRVRPGGSARIQGMGGAQVSLGGDFSSSVSNPGGLGMYNRSEFTFTPGVLSTSTNSQYFNMNNSASKSTLQIPALSLVIHNDSRRGSSDGRKGFLGGSFSVSYNRLNDFNRNVSYSGNNAKNSIIDYFIQDASGFDPSTLLPPNGSYINNPTSLAYDNYLIDDSTYSRAGASKLDYLSPLGTFGGNDTRTVIQQEDIKTSGSQNQVSFAYGGNFSDKFFFGAGVGIATIRYQSIKSYRESNYVFALDPSYRPLDNMVLNETLRTNGTGINATLGLIYRPINKVQIGVSYISPTVYSLNDNYSAVMTTQWNNFDYYGDGSLRLNDQGDATDNVISDYTLTTPSRINVGTTVFIGKWGFLSGDLEYVNYRGSKYGASTGSIDFSSDNNKIRSLYQSATNLRLGGEFRYSNFRLRGGYSYMGDPFQTPQNGTTHEVSSFSGGVGYRVKTFFIDVAAIFTNGNSTYRPYTVNTIDSPVVSLTNKSTMIMATVGFPF